ncbi:unnamed protein product [Boreogadus saida]
MFPRIPRHHQAHQEEVEGCCMCTDHWPQANHHHHLRHHDAPPGAAETQYLPPISWYHRPSPYQHPPEQHHLQHGHPHPPPQGYTHPRPTRPRDPPPGHPRDDQDLGHHHHHHHHQQQQHRRRTQSRTMVLVKNSDPSYRRNIALHHGAPRSLGLFLEEVSELMQYRVRKLYTSEGHKIDSVHGLLHGPSVLICVGREPSHPAILENMPKTGDEKVPRLHVRLSSTGCGEEQEIQGVEKKKTATQPETNGSTNRFPDMPLPGGRNSLEPVDPHPNPEEAVMDDDIEKRVVVNEDGSLSMEMKVRFRLQNDETLQWSTQVTRNGGPKPGEQRQGCGYYLEQSSVESCSESECVVSACETQELSLTQRYQKHMEEAHCTHCCDQCQEYHTWTNRPIPEAQGGGGNVKSSSSSASSHTTVCKRTEVKNTQTTSMSSEECGGQVVETETWVESTINTVDTIKYCTITSAVVDGVDSAEEIPERGTLVPTQREERACSAISASSMILTHLTESLDDEEEDDLPTGNVQNNIESLDSRERNVLTTVNNF